MVIAGSFACGSKPTDPRTVIPNDALVYLETTDLGNILHTIVENPKFQQSAKTKPNLSALDGIPLSVAVTGFETSEQSVTEENSVLNFRPRFVAVVETNAWEWQTSSFVENQLGEFVNEAYGGEVELEVTPRNDGKFYVWTSQEGRKAYALQQGSLVFFGNDESAIERCQAVKRGEADSIARNPNIADGDRLAFGYISPEGIGQIANIAGVSLAMDASEEQEVKGFVAQVLPEILRGSVVEMTWTAVRSEAGIEDRTVIRLDDESSRVLGETIVPAAPPMPTELSDWVPDSALSATRYALRDPQIAWRSVVLTAGRKTDETSGSLLVAFSGSLFEPYGIEDPELFLSSVGPRIVTVKLTADSEDAVVLATATDIARLRRSIAKEISFSGPAENQFGASVWRSQDGELAAAFIEERVVISGDAASVLKCLEARQARSGVPADREPARSFSSSDAVAVTVTNDRDSLRKLVDLISERRDGDEPLILSARTETRFNRNGIERRTVSDFGVIGSIIEQLARE